MLSGKLVRPRLRTIGSIVSVEFLDENAPHWRTTARELIELLHRHVGQTRSTWEQAIEEYEGERIDYIIIRGLAKVLSDQATFVLRETPLPPQELRQKMFAEGPKFARSTLFFPSTRSDVFVRIANEYTTTPHHLTKALYADLRPAHLLQSPGPDWEPTQLLARYNLELARGALYYASSVHIQVYDHFKDIFKFIKLFKLMSEAIPIDGGYQIELYGPISQFISSTLKYGRQFGAWLPALLLCERWSMRATLRLSTEQRTREDEQETLSWSKNQVEYVYSLDSTSSLQTHFKRSGAFDSTLEATFADEFLDFVSKFGEQRDEWQLLREPELIQLQDTVMIPDFAIQHTRCSVRRILIELVGYWSPAYLERKLRKLREAQRAEMLVLVYEGLNVTAEHFQGIASEVLFFKNKPMMNVIVPAIEQLAEKIYGPLPPRQKIAPPIPLPELLQAYYEHYGQEEKEEWMLLTQVGNILKALDPAFTPGRYGFKNLSSLISENETLFATRRRAAKGRPIEVRLLPRNEN